jgi:hypothetical protein
MRKSIKSAMASGLSADEAAMVAFQNNAKDVARVGGS